MTASFPRKYPDISINLKSEEPILSEILSKSYSIEVSSGFVLLI
jgi:hypothetical protein